MPSQEDYEKADKNRKCPQCGERPMGYHLRGEFQSERDDGLKEMIKVFLSDKPVSKSSYSQTPPNKTVAYHPVYVCRKCQYVDYSELPKYLRPDIEDKEE